MPISCGPGKTYCYCISLCNHTEHYTIAIIAQQLLTSLQQKQCPTMHLTKPEATYIWTHCLDISLFFSYCPKTLAYSSLDFHDSCVSFVHLRKSEATYIPCNKLEHLFAKRKKQSPAFFFLLPKNVGILALLAFMIPLFHLCILRSLKLPISRHSVRIPNPGIFPRTP